MTIKQYLHGLRFVFSNGPGGFVPSVPARSAGACALPTIISRRLQMAGGTRNQICSCYACHHAMLRSQGRTLPKNQ